MQAIVSLSSTSLPSGAYKYKRIKDYLYDMQAVLGKGNFSTVYRGVRQGTEQAYAVKVVQLASLTFKKLQELLEQEIAIIRSLDHPHVIRCVEVLKSANHCYFITELCEGGSLEKTLKESSPLPEEEIWSLVSQLFQGLKYLSSRNIVHRDIKPANVFIKEGVLKIADFGFAVHASQTFADFSIGSPLYMSPEGLLANYYGPKTDVWAFGVMLYELIHGKQPLLACSSDEELKTAIGKNIRDQQFKEGISSELREFIKRCLQVNVEKRIAFEQMEKTSYFQRHLNVRSMAEIKILNVSRRPSMPILKCLPRMDTSLRTIQDASRKERELKEAKTDRQNKAGKENNPRKQPMLFPIRIQKRRTRLCNIDLREVEQNKSVFVECCSKDLLKGDLMFNQAIGLIHYCRVGYKLAHEHLSDELGRCLKGNVLGLLAEMQSRVNLGQIKYDLEQNRIKKESKLKLVIGEYLSKYEKEMKGQRNRVPLQELLEKAQQLLSEEERSLQNVKEGKAFAKCYLAMLFANYTAQLLHCIQRKNYRPFGESGTIDNCLDDKSFPKNKGDYFSFKKKYQRSE